MADQSDRPPKPDIAVDGVPEGTWEDHAAARRRKFTRGLVATPAQRWLEGALELAAATGALERARSAKRRAPPW